MTHLSDKALRKLLHAAKDAGPLDWSITDGMPCRVTSSEGYVATVDCAEDAALIVHTPALAAENLLLRKVARAAAAWVVNTQTSHAQERFDQLCRALDAYTKRAKGKVTR